MTNPQQIPESPSLMTGVCGFIKPNHERCKRAIAFGQRLCWQHARGWRVKWRALTRNQAVIFCLGAISLLMTLGFGIASLLPTKTPIVHVESSGSNSPNVVGNTGKVTITDGQQSSNGKNQSKKTSKDNPKGGQR